jgi:hypothetical protein
MHHHPGNYGIESAQESPKMTKGVLGLLIVAIMACVPLARAQEEAAKVEVYGGYYFVRFDIRADLAGVAPSAIYRADGGGGQVEYNINRWLGGVGDFAGYGAANSNGELVGGAFTYLFGPRVNFRLKKVNPFAQVLLGGIAATAGLGQSGDQNNFALTAGGGIDIRVSRLIWLRPVQAEYFMTRLPNGIDNRENNFRIGAGVVVRLVKR